MITVIGLGFVGLTTALGFSQKGQKVFGFDVNKDKTDIILSKKLPFFETGMEEILESRLGKNFFIADSLDSAVKNSNVIFLCVGTPSDAKGKADLTYIKSAIDEVLLSTEKGSKKILIIKSTIPPSTTQKEIVPYIEEKGFKVGKDIFVGNNPEFLREGHAWNDFINPDRIVVGTNDEYTKEVMGDIYKNFGVPIHFVSLNTGEFIKYLSNTFLATLISYSNEMSIIADSIGDIDISSAFRIFHEDKRWFGNPAGMQSYAYPGCGFGGYCLPKDTTALVQKASEYGYIPKILENVIKVNKEIKPHWISKIEKTIPKTSAIGILGLSFKPESDDVRQTPAAEIIRLLLDAGYNNIFAYDPIANKIFDETYKLPVKYAGNLRELLANVNTAIIVTGWSEFTENRELLNNKNIFDMRYVLQEK